jgi:SAM-dependent methyltransferase
MSVDGSQQHIWSHFQNEGSAHVFRASHARHASILRRIRRLAHSDTPMVLNIGIGDGNFEQIVRDLGWPISSLDPDPQAVDRLKAQGVQAEAGSIDKIPFPDEQFDFVVASEVLEHLTPEERHSGLREIKRVLKPRGYLVGTVPYREDLELNMGACPKCRHVFHRWGHTTAFDLATIRRELAAHFKDISCRRTAFVEFKGRSLIGKLKSLVRLMLAKCGAGVAVANIFFVWRRE